MDASLEALRPEYSSIVLRILDCDRPFFGFDDGIQYTFIYNELPAVMGKYDFTNDILQINICFLYFALKEKDQPLQVEYFLLHEIRHKYQSLEIAKYQNGSETETDVERIKRWRQELANYTRPGEGHDGEYFSQDMEQDACAFAYAVITYKYGSVSYLSPPSYYGKEFSDRVDDWHRSFSEKGLPKFSTH